ncbi:MAG: ArsR family transcriptional regulator [Chloroflexi bacterium]|nr:MAG: ArsR family transcriptional regulator [Chloroflexota bacterium]
MVENLKEEVLRLHAQVCSGLADPNRILIIYSLADGPRNVNDIASKMELPQPTVSRHLKILRERSIVRADRDGQTINYRLADHRIIRALDLLRAALADQLKDQALLATQVNENLVG